MTLRAERDSTTDEPAGPLLVLIRDRVSELVRKGEVTQRYYNPASMFDPVHVVLLGDDDPPGAALQEMVGSARLVVHRMPISQGMELAGATSSRLLRHWRRRIVALATQARPTVVRCHVPHVNALLAREVSRALGIPYVVSVHGLPDKVALGRSLSVRGHVGGAVLERMARATLPEAAAVVAVYDALVPWLSGAGARDIRVIRNVVCPGGAAPRGDHTSDALRVVSVGRQIEGKLPVNLVRAASLLPSIELTLIGDGPKHEDLRSLADDLGLGDRVIFRRSVPNDHLCSELRDYDVFAMHNDYPGVPKSAMEAALVGLPLVANRPPSGIPPELAAAGAFVEDTAAGYAKAIAALMDGDAWTSAAAAARQAAQLWEPHVTEAQWAALYREVIERGRSTRK